MGATKRLVWDDLFEEATSRVLLRTELDEAIDALNPENEDVLT